MVPVKTLEEIYDGWKNFVFKSKGSELVAKTRIKLCVECEFFTERKTCKKCGCYMPAKVRSLRPQTKCPIGKW